MTLTRAAVRPAIPAAAWRHRLGDPLPAGRPRVSHPMIDDGPTGGVPIGGIGAGSIGRTCDGDFARWHLRIGTHRFRRVDACQFSLYVAKPGEPGRTRVLSVARPSGPSAWTWDLPAGAGTYHGLFPRAWIEYDPDIVGVRLRQTQLSPVLPHNYRETSYPLGLFEWTVENPTDSPLRVAVMFTWQALDEDARGTPAGATAALRREPGAVGVVLDNDSAADAPIGQFAVVAADEDGVRASARAGYVADGGREIWADFASDGALDGTCDGRPAVDGEDLVGAVALTVDLGPGETRDLRFGLAWDFPLMRFGSGRAWYRRYTRFLGREGTHAFEIASEGLARQRDWEAAIDDWQRPLLEDRSRPSAYVMALLNELYILVDGGSAWEDGMEGSPVPIDGRGRFAVLECYDYAFYNTHDVLFYASWALALLWPQLEIAALRTVLETVPLEDTREVTILANGECARRKVAGATAHDVGAPDEDPWMAPNAYHFQDPNVWKDLGSKLVLQVWRDVTALGARDLAGESWPSVDATLERLAASDVDGDGLPDHDGADQTFDTWPMTGPSAYAGGLYVAALAAAERLAEMRHDEAARLRYRERRERAAGSLRERLWNGRYLLYDGGGPSADSVMADQLCGLWWANATGLDPYLDDAETRTALATMFDRNVRGFHEGRLGAVNGVRPDGSVDRSSEQSQEVWPGVTYTLAALLLERDMELEAWETALGAIRTTYERGFQFRTPEAWDERGDFRASMYLRPLAIWAIEHAVAMRAGRGR